MGNDRQTKYYVPALERSLDIIELLARETLPLSITRISESLDIESSKLYRILSSLVRRGYLAKDANNSSYSLSLKLFSLAHSTDAYKALLRAAEEPMLTLAAGLACSCHLSVIEAGEMVVLHWEAGSGQVAIYSKIGGRRPLCRTSTAIAILAQYDSTESERILQEDTYLATRSAARNEQFRRRISECRDGTVPDIDGTYVLRVHEGVTDFVAPIRVYPRFFAALTVPFLDTENVVIEQESIARTIAETARWIQTNC